MPEFLHVNNEDTLKKMNSSSKDKFVKYYMNNCGHCDDLEPIWKLVESRINKEHQHSDIIIVQLNANFMDNANIPNVDGFPTVSMIKGGKKMDHNGERTEEAIMSFFKKHNLLTSQSGGKRRRKTKRKRKHKRSKRRSSNTVVPIDGRRKKRKICKNKTRKWSRKYKKSINCRHPKGFSQKQYCKTKSKRTRKIK